MIKEHVIPIFNIGLFLISAKDREELADTFPVKEHINDVLNAFDDSIQYSVMIDDGDNVDIYFILNESCLQKECPYIIIAHEAYHILNYVFRIIGHKPSLKEDELEAYLMEHIYSVLFDFLTFVLEHDGSKD